MNEKKEQNSGFIELMQDYFERVTATIDTLNFQEIDKSMKAILTAYDQGADIYVFGNGGSAATASHMTNDFNKGISCGIEKKFRFHCLNDNIATLLAIANDISYADIFYEQLKNRLRAKDLIIAISGSGNSCNIIKAVEYAQSCGCIVIGITGYSGGKLKQIADYSLHADIEDMQVVEDIHLIFNHMMMKAFCQVLNVPKDH